MEGLYTNRSILKDFVINGLRKAGASVTEAYIAVAFVTDSDYVRELVERGIRVRMVVRLGYPTSPLALGKLLKMPGVDIRYFNGHTFHPKLFIFGDREALVGSANLTGSAVMTNQEVTVSIPSDDERFSELAALFSAYWSEAGVLTEDVLKEYEAIFNRYSRAVSDIQNLDMQVVEKIGERTFANIRRGEKKKRKEDIFIDSYRRTYQETVSAFEAIREIYESVGLRKANPDAIPLRLEIDSFFSFVRDTYTSGESWRETEIGFDPVKQSLLREHITEWLNTEWPHFDDDIVNTNYPLIRSVFGSPESIASSDMSQIISALVVLHSFHDRLRFYSGGLETLKATFAQTNDLDTVRRSLTHLLFGNGDIVQRMSDLIYDSDYKLNAFGQANVQELVGWVNNAELPVVNGRTTKILRYYGFEVTQL